VFFSSAFPEFGSQKERVRLFLLDALRGHFTPDEHFDM